MTQLPAKGLFVDYHEERLFTEIAGFNRVLAQWLVFYNTEHRLGLRSPIQSLLIRYPEC